MYAYICAFPDHKGPPSESPAAFPFQETVSEMLQAGGLQNRRCDCMEDPPGVTLLMGEKMGKMMVDSILEVGTPKTRKYIYIYSDI